MTPHDIDATSGEILATHPKPGTSRSDRQVKPCAALAGALALIPALGSAPVDTAIQWATAARHAEVVGVFARIMAGFAFRQIKEILGVKQGARSDLAADPRLAEGWEGFLKKHAGISPDSASNWMKLAEAMQPRLKKLGKLDPEKLLNLSALDDAEMARVQKAVAKLCDGQSYSQLALELGIVKKAKGAGAKGGDKGHGGGDEPLPEEAPDGWTQSDWDLYRDLAEHNPAAREAWDKWEPLIKALESEGLEEKTWAALPDRLHARLHAAVSELHKLVPAKISAAKSTTKKN